MLNKEYMLRLKEAVSGYESSRRSTIRLSDDIRNSSKKAIFAMHRDDMESAGKLLESAERGVAEVRKLAGENGKLNEEGSFRAALEEMVEATLYRKYLAGESLGELEIAGVEVPYDIYIGGLSDVVGELQRRQVRLATSGDFESVKSIRDSIEEIIGAMLDMDLTGYYRNKFDQAKNSFRRAEEVLYDMSIRRQA